MSLTNMIQAFTQAAGMTLSMVMRAAHAPPAQETLLSLRPSAISGGARRAARTNKTAKYRYTWRSPIAPATPPEAAAGAIDVHGGDQG